MKYVFNSILSKELNDYLSHRINNGFSESSHYNLTLFDSFLIEKNIKVKIIDKDLMDEWALQKNSENKNTRNSRVGAVRQFTLYLNSIGIEAYVPNYHFTSSKTVPYVLGEDELVHLFGEIDKHFTNYSFGPTIHYKFMMPVFFRLLYSCGLRNNEACQLKTTDLDSMNKTIHITDGKNRKDRIVYVIDDMYTLIEKYLKARKEYIISEWLFPSRHADKPVFRTTISAIFHKAVIKANIGSSEHYPTPHSLRHTYVVHLVDSWTKKGYKVDTLMPYLSKQLGHTSTEDTFYYYHMLDSSYDSILGKDRNLLPEVQQYEED